MKVVYLKRNKEDIFYGDLTTIANQLPKTKVVKGKRIEIKYTKEEINEWQETLTDTIVARLNKTLPNKCIREQTMYYYAVQL